MKLPIYFDYAATTPVDPKIANIMQEYLTLDGNFANPASTSHIYGIDAKQAVESARQEFANIIKADPREIVWTSGATEANNLAIIGVANFYQSKGKKHIITCKTEHKAVLDSCHFLESKGFAVTYLTPEKNGLVDLEKLTEAIRDDTVLISIMHVNNELGVIQDIKDIGDICKQHKVFFHVDAAQSIGKLDINLQELSVDLMSFCAHKIYGPKGIGALYVKRKPKVRLEPMIHGGGHEQGMRSGTLPTYQIVGMVAAIKLAVENMQQEQDGLTGFRDKLIHALTKIPKVYINGDLEHHISGILNFSVAGVDGEALLFAIRDLAISTGSACNSTTVEPSYVLQALGISALLASSTIRISIGRFTTEAEVDYAINCVTMAITKLRSISPGWDDKNEV